MARLQDMASGRKDLYLLDPSIIREDGGWNERDNNDELKAHIRQLADSIKEIGVQQPLTVYLRDGVPIITDGHCRLMAARLAISEGAEIKSIPCRNEERTSNEADRTLSMLTRNSGKPLTSLEASRVIKRLIGFGWVISDISRKTGYTTSHIYNLITLASSPVEIQKMVSDGEISATLATETVKKQGETEAVETLKSAVKKAGDSGKKKATKKHIEPGATKKTNWNKVGPQLLSVLRCVDLHGLVDDEETKSMVKDVISLCD